MSVFFIQPSGLPAVLSGLQAYVVLLFLLFLFNASCRDQLSQSIPDRSLHQMFRISINITAGDQSDLRFPVAQTNVAMVTNFWGVAQNSFIALAFHDVLEDRNIDIK